MKLTPHGIVHMGLSSASPTALQDWLPRSDRLKPSPTPQDLQGAAVSHDSAQAAHLPGQPAKISKQARQPGRILWYPSRPALQFPKYTPQLRRQAAQLEPFPASRL